MNKKLVIILAKIWEYLIRFPLYSIPLSIIFTIQGIVTGKFFNGMKLRSILKRDITSTSKINELSSTAFTYEYDGIRWVQTILHGSIFVILSVIFGIWATSFCPLWFVFALFLLVIIGDIIGVILVKLGKLKGFPDWSPLWITIWCRVKKDEKTGKLYTEDDCDGMQKLGKIFWKFLKLNNPNEPSIQNTRARAATWIPYNQNYNLFRLLSFFVRYINTVHSFVVIEPINQVGYKIYNYSVCEKVFSNKEEIEKHMMDWSRSNDFEYTGFFYYHKV